MPKTLPFVRNPNPAKWTIPRSRNRHIGKPWQIAIQRGALAEEVVPLLIWAADKFRTLKFDIIKVINFTLTI
ncbi:hypothetical protein [Paraburkholderia sp. RL17-373-BIF-A]|uniref:hypothetical protein n=1 Tax=Paraburkholderia sp. RL17-373-BIF-A TaxID=3031629 RepID=UPI0038B7365D